ncbi:MAG: hypothetical protein VB138_05690 [Burkholderia sp.]
MDIYLSPKATQQLLWHASKLLQMKDIQQAIGEGSPNDELH